MSTAVLFEALSYSAIAPLLPHYADTLDLSKSGAGALVGSYTCGSLAGALPGGLLANRVGVKQTLVVGLAILGWLRSAPRISRETRDARSRTRGRRRRLTGIFSTRLRRD